MRGSRQNARNAQAVHRKNEVQRTCVIPVLFVFGVSSALVPSEVIDHLLRHTRFVGARYTDPSSDVQAAALEKLPKLWPAQMPNPTKIVRKNEKKTEFPLDKCAQISETDAESPCTAPSSSKAKSISRAGCSKACALVTQPLGAVKPAHELDLEHSGAAGSRGCQEQNGFHEALMSVSAAQLPAPTTGPDDAMTVLLCLANSLHLLLRRGASDGPDRSGANVRHDTTP